MSSAHQDFGAGLRLHPLTGAATSKDLGFYAGSMPATDGPDLDWVEAGGGSDELWDPPPAHVEHVEADSDQIGGGHDRKHVEIHSLLDGMSNSFYLKKSSSNIETIGIPCDLNGDDLPPGTSPLVQSQAPVDDYSPFMDQSELNSPTSFIRKFKCLVGE